ncbi:MAG: hypothetical protein BWY74_02038 [Firmicutes bacterium ADurb.Bin419]|nr:MAG: hypothetical protein BWY74_02038 [Firmicutes bacterium ADurb.Bin419]
MDSELNQQSKSDNINDLLIFETNARTFIKCISVLINSYSEFELNLNLGGEDTTVVKSFYIKVLYKTFFDCSFILKKLGEIDNQYENLGLLAHEFENEYRNIFNGDKEDTMDLQKIFNNIVKEIYEIFSGTKMQVTDATIQSTNTRTFIT